jgi:biotin transport system ATP-binding protein
MIEAARLSFAYDRGVRALAEMDFRIPAGSLAVVAGANGSGKSTLLSLLAGLETPASGSLRLGDFLLPGQEAAARRLARLVVQDADLHILGATLAEDLLLGREQDGPAAARAMARRFGLLEHWDSPVQTLSYGMRRKLCLAGALLDGPRLLLLDEPFAGLDHPGTREMRAILQDNRKAGLTQVLSTHDLDPVADLADLLLVLERGRLALCGAPAEVLPGLRGLGVRPPCSWLAGRGLEYPDA